MLPVIFLQVFFFSTSYLTDYAEHFLSLVIEIFP